MVFLSLPSWVRHKNLESPNKGPEEFWRKRKIFKLAAHLSGRNRNCYSLAVRSVFRIIKFSSIGRRLKKEDMRELAQSRVDSAARQHGLEYHTLSEGLSRCNVYLNRKSLCDLAIWEPRTFKSLTNIALARLKQDGLRPVKDLELPPNIITKGGIK